MIIFEHGYLLFKRGHSEDTALQVRRGGERHVDCASVHGRGDAVNGKIIERDAVDGDATDRYDMPSCIMRTIVLSPRLAT
jgi:hypothetical protein